MVLPATWTVLDLDPRTRDRSVERMVKRAIGQADHLAKVRHEAVVLYRELLADAADRGAFLAATVSEIVDDTALAASLLAFVVPLPTGDDGTPIDSTDAMFSVLGEPTEDEQLIERSVVELGVGAAVRLRALVGSGVTSSDGQEPEVDVVRYFVPVPAREILLVMAFSTPALFAADAFAELFDALARSASWRSGEETK